jgi:hypothetical protein
MSQGFPLLLSPLHRETAQHKTATTVGPLAPLEELGFPAIAFTVEPQFARHKAAVGRAYDSNSTSPGRAMPAGRFSVWL